MFGHKKHCESDIQIYRSELVNGVWQDPGVNNGIAPPGEYAYTPSVAISDTGDALVAWRAFSSSGSYLARTHRKGQSWSFSQRVTSLLSGTPNEFSLDMNDAGQAVITWSQYATSIPMIYVSEYNGVSWTEPSDVADALSLAGQVAQTPKVDMDNEGNIVVGFIQVPDPGIQQILVAEKRAGQWIVPTRNEDQLNAIGDIVSQPSIAVSENGDALAVWSQLRSGNNHLYRSHYR